MSPGLPPRPSLDHLRKAAKARLRALRQSGLQACLADAQHAIAREHGFASWPKLTAHVAALTRTSPTRASGTGGPPLSPPTALGHPGGEGGSRGPVFHRFSERARKALFFARWEAAQLGSTTIGPEHLLLGLLKAREDLPGRLSLEARLALASVRADIRRWDAEREPLPTTVMIPFDEQAKGIAVRAADEADRHGHSTIGSAHVVLALLREPAPAVAALLIAAHVDYAWAASDPGPLGWEN